MIAAGEAGAQSAVQGVPNAMQGFSQNCDQPIQIEAATLEMRDKKEDPTFAGNVKVVQGDTTMTSKKLVALDDTPRQLPARGLWRQRESPGQVRVDSVGYPWSRRQLVDWRLEAQGNVVVTQKDQIVTGDTALFQHQDQSRHHAGRRGVDAGQCLLRGDRLMVDMTTGVSRVESDSGRVQGLFQSSGQGGPVIPGTAPAPGAAGKQK